ncbi:hypothetical protein C3F09_09755 [candidate division GN15 bacterium]|uniref:Uncharacterized protein n=1 Tax=candidate division GN15 bacterium TaxID=2072418 RepID=A0A855WYW7_9BACT|nr:MAG: hypothetical protein C3F09_09755 [candidate division GN15 bacterium]
MKTYLFAVPLAPGKTETWKNYVREMTGPRNEEYRQSRKRAGIEVEQVFLQQTPRGDMCVVMIKGENPRQSFERMRTSNEPFDKWFREKILIEAHGLDLNQPMPENQQVLEYYEVPIRETAGSRRTG